MVEYLFMPTIASCHCQNLFVFLVVVEGKIHEKTHITQDQESIPTLEDIKIPHLLHVFNHSFFLRYLLLTTTLG